MSATPSPSTNMEAKHKRPFLGPAFFRRGLAPAMILILMPLTACNESPQFEKHAKRIGINHAEDATKPISLAQDNRYSLPSLSSDKKPGKKLNRSDLSANGEELYTVLCSSCHGGAIHLVGKNLGDLQKAIEEVPEMASLDGVIGSDPELSDALFNYINGNSSP
ncbi:MAG: hypothetical protein EOP07_06725 [Proteobacteria bacterium]|nr:MAG: hypothetical protein EOP07_06725 [Pseudomonadota bacterium]